MRGELHASAAISQTAVAARHLAVLSHDLRRRRNLHVHRLVVVVVMCPPRLVHGITGCRTAVWQLCGTPPLRLLQEGKGVGWRGSVMLTLQPPWTGCGRLCLLRPTAMKYWMQNASCSCWNGATCC